MNARVTRFHVLKFASLDETEDAGARLEAPPSRHVLLSGLRSPASEREVARARARCVTTERGNALLKAWRTLQCSAAPPLPREPCDALCRAAETLSLTMTHRALLQGG